MYKHYKILAAASILSSLAVLGLCCYLLTPKFDSVDKGSPLDLLSLFRYAENTYKERNQSYGTLRDLGNAGLIEDKEVVSGRKWDYKIECVADNNTYMVIITPDDPYTWSTYRMTQTGMVEIKHHNDNQFRPYNPKK